MNSMIRSVTLAALVAIAAALPGMATAQSTLVVPFPPGSLADTVARSLAAELGKASGKIVVIQNLPGGAQATALTVAQTVDTRRDGQTIYVFRGGMANTPADVERGFRALVPVAMISESGGGDWLGAFLPPGTRDEFVRQAEARVLQALDSSELQERLRALNQQRGGGSRRLSTALDQSPAVGTKDPSPGTASTPATGTGSRPPVPGQGGSNTGQTGSSPRPAASTQGGSGSGAQGGSATAQRGTTTAQAQAPASRSAAAPVAGNTPTAVCQAEDKADPHGYVAKLAAFGPNDIIGHHRGIATAIKWLLTDVYPKCADDPRVQQHMAGLRRSRDQAIQNCRQLSSTDNCEKSPWP